MIKDPPVIGCRCEQCCRRSYELALAHAIELELYEAAQPDLEYVRPKPFVGVDAWAPRQSRRDGKRYRKRSRSLCLAKVSA